MSCILIAHESDDIRELFTFVLGAYDQIITAADGDQAIKLFDRYKPGIVIIHTSLPIVSGYEVVKHIRVTKLAVKIIATSSACARTHKHNTILEAGADLCISTPVDMQVLITTVQSMDVQGMDKPRINFNRDKKNDSIVIRNSKGQEGCSEI